MPLQKLLCRHKNQFYWMQIIFLFGTKCLWLPQYVNKFLVWHKKFGPAQNILGPVKGQGISFLIQGTRTLACMGAQNCIDSHLDIFPLFSLTAATQTNMYLELNWILNLCQLQDKLVLSYLIASQTMALWQTWNWLSGTFFMPFYVHPDFPVQWLF